MPHVIVKLWPGKSEAKKRQLSQAIVRDVTSILKHGEESVSVAFEEIPACEWTALVYGTDIQRKWNNLTKQPGYGPGPPR